MLEAEPRETSGSVVPVKLIVRFAFLIRSPVHTFLRFVLVAVRNSSRCYLRPSFDDQRHIDILMQTV